MSDGERTPAEELEGRELDVAIEREVFGSRVERSEDGNEWICPELRTAQLTIDADGAREATMVPPVVPNYSSDVAAAWGVLDQLREDRIGVICEIHWDWEDPEYGFAVRVWIDHDQDRPVFARNASLPLAICRAALKAVRSDR